MIFHYLKPSLGLLEAELASKNLDKNDLTVIMIMTIFAAAASTAVSLICLKCRQFHQSLNFKKVTLNTVESTAIFPFLQNLTHVYG